MNESAWTGVTWVILTTCWFNVGLGLLRAFDNRNARCRAHLNHYLERAVHPHAPWWKQTLLVLWLALLWPRVLWWLWSLRA